MRRRRAGRPRCRAVRRELQAYLDQELRAEAAWATARHLARCEDCYNDVDAYRRIKTAVRRRRVPPDPAVLTRLATTVGRIGDLPG